MKKIIINKDTMRNETLRFIEVLFSLPEVERVALKDITLISIEDLENINRGLDACYHDNMSDVDINVWIAVKPSLFDSCINIYKKFFERLQVNNRIFGILFQDRDNNGKEGMRICLESGFRIDLSCHVRCDEKAVFPMETETENANYAVEKENGLIDREKIDAFWFIAIQALAKLLRKDYLIADHLSHMLLMEGLVIQMVERDNQYGTNFHRYGYAEELAYRSVQVSGFEKYFSTEDDTFNHIAENLVRAALCMDELAIKNDSGYRKRSEIFFAIWDCYLGEND